LKVRATRVQRKFNANRFVAPHLAKRVLQQRLVRYIKPHNLAAQSLLLWQEGRVGGARQVRVLLYRRNKLIEHLRRVQSQARAYQNEKNAKGLLLLFRFKL
jgi:hypothetical protein